MYLFFNVFLKVQESPFPKKPDWKVGKYLWSKQDGSKIIWVDKVYVRGHYREITAQTAIRSQKLFLGKSPSLPHRQVQWTHYLASLMRQYAHCLPI